MPKIDYSGSAFPKPGAKKKKKPGKTPQKVRRESRERAYKRLCDLLWVERRGKCEKCLKSLPREYAEFHHKKFRSQGGEDTEENLIMLCGDCHKAAHGIKVVR